MLALACANRRLGEVCTHVKAKGCAREKQQTPKLPTLSVKDEALEVHYLGERRSTSSAVFAVKLHVPVLTKQRSLR